MKTLTQFILLSISIQILSSSLLSKPTQTPEPIPHEAGKSLYVSSSKGNLRQFDPITGHLQKNQDISPSSNIISLSKTTENSYLYFSSRSSEGNFDLNQLSIPTQTPTIIYQNYAGDNELPIISSNDSKLIFTGSDVGGNNARIKLWSPQEKTQKSEHPWGHNFDIGITSLAITQDDEYLYVGSEYGSIQVFKINPWECIANYKESLIDEDSNILSMVVSRDNEFLFMSNDKGYVKQFSNREMKFVRSWGQVMNGQINRILVDDRWLYVGDCQRYEAKGPVGGLKMFSVVDGKLEKDFGVVVPGGIEDMVLDGGRMFLGGTDGHVYEFCLKEGKVVMDLGKVVDGMITGMVL